MPFGGSIRPLKVHFSSRCTLLSRSFVLVVRLLEGNCPIGNLAFVHLRLFRSMHMDYWGWVLSFEHCVSSVYLQRRFCWVHWLPPSHCSGLSTITVAFSTESCRYYPFLFMHFHTHTSEVESASESQFWPAVYSYPGCCSEVIATNLPRQVILIDGPTT